MQEAEPLGPSLRVHRRDAGDVAAWSIEAGNQTSLHRIGTAAVNDRDRCSCSLRRGCCRRAAGRSDDRHPAADQIDHQFRQPIKFIARPTVFDRHVLAFDVAGFAQAFAECCHEVSARLRRTSIEISDHRHRRLLRARRERPRGHRPAEERDEFTPYHCLTPPVLPTERIAHLRRQEAAAVRDFKPAYVGSGSGPTKLTVSITSPLYPRKRTLEWVKQDQDDPPVCRRRCSQYRRTLSLSWNSRPEPRSITPSFVRS